MFKGNYTYEVFPAPGRYAGSFENHGYVIRYIFVSSIANKYTYTLSHPENDRDFTERAQGYTLQEASIPLCVKPGVPF